MLKDIFTISGRWGRLNRQRFFLYSLFLLLLPMVILIMFALSNTIFTIQQKTRSYFMIPTVSAQMIGSGDRAFNVVPARGITAASSSLNDKAEFNLAVRKTRSIVNLVLYGLGLLTMLVVLWGNICLGVKRLHDLDQSGWMLLVGLIPVVGILLAIYMLFFKGTCGKNKFGADPLSL